jgi:hypothetical protein
VSKRAFTFYGTAVGMISHGIVTLYCNAEKGGIDFIKRCTRVREDENDNGGKGNSVKMTQYV